MAKFAVYTLLALLAVIPFVAVARSLGQQQNGELKLDLWDTEGENIQIPGAALQVEGASANDNGLYFSIQSLFQSSETPRCADIDDNGNVVMADCEAGSTNQLWSSEDTVIKHYSGKCLEVCVTNCHYRFLGRKRIWIKDCTGDVAQQWLTIDGKRIQSKQNGDCMDVCDSMTCSPRGDVITYDCHDESNQKWGLILGGYAGPPALQQQATDLRDFAGQWLD